MSEITVPDWPPPPPKPPTPTPTDPEPWPATEMVPETLNAAVAAAAANGLHQHALGFRPVGRDIAFEVAVTSPPVAAAAALPPTPTADRARALARTRDACRHVECRHCRRRRRATAQ